MDLTAASTDPSFLQLNLLVKKVKRAGHGFRSFTNYRFRILLHAGGVDWPAARPSPPRIRTRHPTETGRAAYRLDLGDTFVVTRNGVPVGELTPLRRHRFVTADAAVAAFRNAPGIDADRFRTDLDRVANQDTAPRG